MHRTQQIGSAARKVCRETWPRAHASRLMNFCCCVQCGNVARLMQALREVHSAPRGARQTFLLEFNVMDAPFWCVTAENLPQQLGTPAETLGSSAL